MRREKKTCYYYGSEIMFREDILNLTAVPLIKTSKLLKSQVVNNMGCIKQLWQTINIILFEFIWIEPNDFIQEVIFEARTMK